MCGTASDGLFESMVSKRLILEVQNNSIIYETSHLFYKNNSKKEKAWDEIKEVLGVNGEFVKLSNILN